MFVSMVSTLLVICYDNFVLQPIKIRRLAITFVACSTYAQYAWIDQGTAVEESSYFVIAGLHLLLYLNGPQHRYFLRIWRKCDLWKTWIIVSCVKRYINGGMKAWTRSCSWIIFSFIEIKQYAWVEPPLHGITKCDDFMVIAYLLDC